MPASPQSSPPSPPIRCPGPIQPHHRSRPRQRLGRPGRHGNGANDHLWETGRMDDVGRWPRPLMLLTVVVAALVLSVEVAFVGDTLRWRRCGLDGMGAQMVATIVYGGPRPGDCPVTIDAAGFGVSRSR